MKNLILILLSLSAGPILAKPSIQSEFVSIRPGVRLYVQHYPAAPGRPTLFLLNGLTYSTREYEPLIGELRKADPGLGVVAYDMRGMGKTLLDNLDMRNDRIPVEQQANDLHDLVKTLGISGSLSVAGLSYGGAVGQLHSTLYPNDFENYISLAPLIERLPDQDSLLNAWVHTHKVLYPMDPRSEDELYDFYLRNWIYSTYPLAEPIILQNPYKIEGIFRMVQGVKNWNSFENVRKFPKGKFHLVAAVQDEHVKLSRLDLFWDKLPANVRASYMRLDRSKHKIPEQWPRQTAAWLLQILNKNPHLYRGLAFDGDPIAEEARSGNIVIPLNQVGHCEQALLRAVPELSTH